MSAISRSTKPDGLQSSTARTKPKSGGFGAFASGNPARWLFNHPIMRPRWPAVPASQQPALSIEPQSGPRPSQRRRLYV